MKFFNPTVCAALSIAWAASAAHAVEFKSVGAAPAVLYDAPSVRGKKVFVAPRNTPVEVVFVYGEWVKVRDVDGDLSWTEAKSLNARRTVMINVINAKIRAAADEASPVTFSANKGVVLELSEPAGSGWIKVKHGDGQSGYVKTTDVWGV